MKKNSIILMLVISATFLDLFIQLPIISNYGFSVGGGAVLVGLIVASYSITNMIGNFLAGRVIDKWGRKKSITRGLAASAIFVSSYGLFANPYWLLLMRGLHGLALSIVNPASYASFSDGTNECSRGSSMAKSGITIGSAAVIGPLLGGMLKDIIGARLVFVIIGLIHLSASILAVHIKEKEQEEAKETKKQVSYNTQMLVAYSGAFILMFANGVLTFSFPKAMEGLGYGGGITGAGFSTFALAAMIVFVTPLGKLSDKIGRQKPILMGIMLVTVALGCLSVFGTIVPIIVSMFIYGLGFGTIFPASSALLVDNTNSMERNTAFGIYYGIFSFGAFIGPLIASWLINIGIDSFGGSSAIITLLALIGVTHILIEKRRIGLNREI